jgi:hypothetical protein
MIIRRPSEPDSRSPGTISMPQDAEIHATTSARLTEEQVRFLGRDLLHFAPDQQASMFAEAGWHPLSIVDLSTEPWLTSDFPCANAVTILAVRWAGNYYGPGYERGYWPHIAAVIQFLKHRLPDCRVWYRADSGDSSTEMTPEAMGHLWHYWSHHGCRPYHERHSQHGPRDAMPICDECAQLTEFLTFSETTMVAFCPRCGQIYAQDESDLSWQKIKAPDCR